MNKKNGTQDITMPSPGSSMFVLIKYLLDNLFIAEKRRLDKFIADMIRKNNELSKIQASGFRYNGEYYTASGFQTTYGAVKPSLHDSLYNEMDWYIQDALTIANDERLIGQIIYKLTDPCETFQEMRDSLPDCLATMIPALKALPRNNEEGWSLRQDTRASNQFEKLLPKIEMYSAARLLY